MVGNSCGICAYSKHILINKNCVVRQCNQCFNFWINPEKMFNEANKDYPETGQQPCIKLTYNILKDAVTTTHNKIINDEWTDAMTKSYLTKYCLNNNAKNQIIEYANNVKKLKVAKNNNQDDVVAAHFLKEETPEKYEMWKFPTLWNSSLALEDMTEPIMHQFFLGVVKNLLLELMDWASLRKMGVAIKNHLFSKTQLIHKMKLSWIKV